MANGEPAVKTAIERGVAYLTTVQRSDGGFDSFSSPSATRFKKVFTYQTTFTPALILAALADVDTTPARRLKRRLAVFVRDQAGPDWSFNYWVKTAPERRQLPYPDDLDDTCCALAGLFLYDPKMVGADVLAAFVKLLLFVEAQVGGPYGTWLVPPDSPAVWRDVDLAVNANVAYLLSLVGEPLPNLNAHMEKSILSGRLASPYYVSAFPLVYYLARSYRGPAIKRLLELASSMRSEKLTPLQAALLLTSLSRLGAGGTEPLVGQLLAGQEADGSWPAGAFCLDPARDGRKYYSGSEALTTALAVEALQVFVKRPKTANIANRRLARPAVPAGHRHRVMAAARRDLKSLEPDLRTTAMDSLEKMASSSAGPEIIGLPQAFYQSLAPAKGMAKITPKALTRLSLANLYGWMAYTIFDDFIDEEGRPGLLPAASLALRYSADSFAETLPNDREFQKSVRQTFDIIDGANAWELAHCRCRRQGQQLIIDSLPDYGDLSKLAERSLGHGLTPLAVLRLGGTNEADTLFTGVRQAFRHYLIARQLNDDLHDWQDDLGNGHLTYVATRVLSDTGIGPGNHGRQRLLRLAQRQFWNDSLPALCQTVRDHTARSREILEDLPLRQPNFLAGLLDKIDAATAEALSSQAEASAFLKQYKRAAKR